MESSNNYTPSIRDKWNCRTSCTSSKGRDISRIIVIWIGWYVVSDSMACCCFLRNDQDLLAEGKSQNERRFGGIFIGHALFVVGFWDEDILTAEIAESEKLDASETYPRRLIAKEVLVTQKDGNFIFLVTDGSAKLSERDYEFPQPTLRRESTEKRGESQQSISRRKGRVST